MKKNVFLLMLISFMLLTTYFVSVKAVENPISVATVNYRDFEYITIYSPFEVNLSFICSESFDENAVTCEKIEYYPVTNETKYKFTSDIVSPDYYFEHGLKKYMYQDENTGQIYVIYVDYTDIEVPDNPLENKYNNLLTNYTEVLNEYNNLYNDYENLSVLLDIINNTIYQYTNDTDKNITTHIKDIYNNFNALYITYNNTYNNLTNLSITYNQLYEQYNEIKDDATLLLSNYANLLVDYNTLNESLNETNTLFIEKSGELGEYKTFFQTLLSPQNIVYFKGNQYQTFYSYQKQIDDLENRIGLTPIYVVFSVLMTACVVFLLYKRHVGNMSLSSFGKDIKYNYPKEAGLLDKFSMMKNKRKKETLPKKGEKGFNAVENLPPHNKGKFQDKVAEKKDEETTEFTPVDDENKGE
jgi:hypothetical protein